MINIFHMRQDNKVFSQSVFFSECCKMRIVYLKICFISKR